MPNKEIKIIQKPGSLGGVSLHCSHHANLVGYGSTFEKALASLRSVYAWEHLPFPPIGTIVEEVS